MCDFVHLGNVFNTENVKLLPTQCENKMHGMVHRNQTYWQHTFRTQKMFCCSAARGSALRDYS